MSVELVARRYATALADVLGKDYKTVQTELKTFAGIMNESDELASVFGNPAISHHSKAKVLDTILDKTKPGRITANFLRVLLENGRIVNLPEINKSFTQVLEERSGIAAVQVTSARELSADEQKDLVSGVEKMLGKKANLTYKIDKNIIGGIVTRIGSTVYDSSVKTQLENLKKQLVNG